MPCAIIAMAEPSLNADLLHKLIDRDYSIIVPPATRASLKPLRLPRVTPFEQIFSLPEGASGAFLKLSPLLLTLLAQGRPIPGTSEHIKLVFLEFARPTAGVRPDFADPALAWAAANAVLYGSQEILVVAGQADGRPVPDFLPDLESGSPEIYRGYARRAIIAVDTHLQRVRSAGGF